MLSSADYGRSTHTPCVAAHSTTRALYASFNGALYQVKCESDGRTLDIGVVKPSRSDSGGYSDPRAQDAFCEDTICVIQRIDDQSGRGNDLLQAPGRGRSKDRRREDSISNEERETIESMGTPGATTTRSATAAVDTVIPVTNAFGFRAGQTVTIGEDAKQETVVVAATARRGALEISIEMPLKFAHALGTEVAGTGILLTSALSRAHVSGSQIADYLPTPGAPN